MNETATPNAKRFRIGWWTPIGLLAVIGGVVLLYISQPIETDTVVDRIRITESSTISKPGGATDSAIEKVKRSLANPDYYLHLVTDAGEVDTEIRYDMPIGNGLTFDLPSPILLSTLKEVRVMHESLLADPIIDRVDVSGMTEQGQLFRFDLLAQPIENPTRDYRPIAGWSLIGVGGLLLLITVVRFIHDQVV